MPFNDAFDKTCPKCGEVNKCTPIPEDEVVSLGLVPDKNWFRCNKCGEPFNSMIDYTVCMRDADQKYSSDRFAQNRKDIPFFILKNIAYQLVLDKYLQLFNICWKNCDEEGNYKRFSECLNSPAVSTKNIDAKAEYLLKLPLDKPSKKVAKDFFQKVFCGKLEFACNMHVINGYTAFDFAQGFYNHYNDGTDLVFNKRYKFEQMIFLPE